MTGYYACKQEAANLLGRSSLILGDVRRKHKGCGHHAWKRDACAPVQELQSLALPGFIPSPLLPITPSSLHPPPLDL
jgi:hypothetical protein